MSIGEIILIGLSLSMDAFAVSISSSMAYTDLTRMKKLSMPIAFGFFQFLMPVLGYFLGGLFSVIIDKYAGIVAFIILAIIGGNMIKEGIMGDDESTEHEYTFKTLILQAIATSIDAFAVGVSFSALGVHIFSSSTIIGITTFVCSLFAVAMGTKIGERVGDKAVIAGGIVLVCIGIKCLIF